MTTYAENHLTISGPRKDLETFRENAVGIDNSYRPEEYNRLCFERLVPIPKHIDQSNDYEKYMEWREKNLGCDSVADLTTCSLFCDEAGRGQLVYEFLTAGGHPDKLIKRISARYPRLLFTLLVTDECGYAALFMARRGKLAKCFDEPYREYMYGDEVFHDGGTGNWKFFTSPDERPSDSPGPISAPTNSSSHYFFDNYSLRDQSSLDECDNMPAWNYRLKVAGPECVLKQFRRDACNDNPHNDNTVTLGLGKLFPLRRFRDQEDTTRFLRCDRIGKASLAFVKPDDLKCASLELRFTAAWIPLLNFIRMVSPLFPLLAFCLTSFRGGKGSAETGTFIAGKLCDYKHDGEDADKAS